MNKSQDTTPTPVAQTPPTVAQPSVVQKNWLENVRVGGSATLINEEGGSQTVIGTDIGQDLVMKNGSPSLKIPGVGTAHGSIAVVCIVIVALGFALYWSSS